MEVALVLAMLGVIYLFNKNRPASVAAVPAPETTTPAAPLS